MTRKTKDPGETGEAGEAKVKKAETAQAGAPPDAGPKEAAAKPPEEMAARLAALEDKFRRALAEAENVRRQAARAQEEAARFSIAALARDLLAICDNLHRALQAASPEGAQAQSPDKLLDGVRMTAREMEAILARHGVRKIEAQGRAFDPHRHEALFETPAPNAAPGEVVQVVEEGYMIGERLLRPARVGIAAPASARGAGGEPGAPETAPAGRSRSGETRPGGES